jgi:hypothetical protein
MIALIGPTLMMFCVGGVYFTFFAELIQLKALVEAATGVQEGKIREVNEFQ